MENFVIPHWSKYKGKAIGDVPRSYLEFLLEQSWINKHPELEEAIEEDLEIRDRSHITF